MPCSCPTPPPLLFCSPFPLLFLSSSKFLVPTKTQWPPISSSMMLNAPASALLMLHPCSWPPPPPSALTPFFPVIFPPFCIASHAAAPACSLSTIRLTGVAGQSCALLLAGQAKSASVLLWSSAAGYLDTAQHLLTRELATMGVMNSHQAVVQHDQLD